MQILTHPTPHVDRSVRPAHIVTCLHCRACQRGFFTAGTPDPQACPACSGGSLLPTGVWDLAHEAAPAGMLRLVSDASLQRLEVDL